MAQKPRKTASTRTYKAANGKNYNSWGNEASNTKRRTRKPLTEEQKALKRTRARARTQVNKLQKFLDDNPNLSNVARYSLYNRIDTINTVLHDTDLRRMKRNYATSSAQASTNQLRNESMRRLNSAMGYFAGDSNKRKTRREKKDDVNQAITQSMSKEIGRALSPSYAGESRNTALGEYGYSKARAFMQATHDYWEGARTEDRAQLIVEGAKNDGYNVSNLADVYEIFLDRSGGDDAFKERIETYKKYLSDGERVDTSDLTDEDWENIERSIGTPIFSDFYRF